jgi:aminoglycoside N3'-acetyltransferase
LYTPTWKAVQAHISRERMQAEIAEFFEFARWSSFDKIVGLAERIAGKMEAAGLQEVRLIAFPADGRTAHGGWKMPRAYDVQEARLTLLAPEASDKILADYHRNPVSLMMYSLPTPPEGITAELTVADSVEEMTPERVSGRLVLTSGIGVEFSQAAMRAGAYGLVSDCRNAHRFFKDGPAVDLTNEWHNYTIPPWDDPGKGFGFSLSPEQGRRLRTLLTEGQAVRLHALVKSRHYDGTLPVVSGLLRGLEPEEIVLTGHYDENGADDNCSQVAVALEVCRAIRSMLQAGEIPPLRRSIRVLLPMEVRGFNALIQNEEETRYMRAGLNIDTVGTDQNSVTSTCTLSDSFIALPSYTDDFVAELLTCLAEENPLFRWRRTESEMIDNIFGEPLIGAPTPALWHYSATHHLATDTPDRISGRMLADMARVAATYTAFLANAGLPEALWLAELVGNQAAIRFQEVVAKNHREGSDPMQTAQLHRQLTSLYDSYSQKLGSSDHLVPSVPLLPTPEIVAAQRQNLLGPDFLLPQELFQERVSALKAQINRDHDAARAQMPRQSQEFFGTEIPVEVERTVVSRCVPVKTFRGFAAFEDLNTDDRAYLHNVLEFSHGWGAPMWLQNALMLANGKRTAGEIASLLQLHTRNGPEVKRLEQIFDFLAHRGMVRLRPYLTQAEVKRALSRAGLEKGDVVLGHFALSRFGYIEDGAEGLIETLLTILGPEGTLVMPTFTFSWIGRLPYDPRTTPSRVGAVTDRFWRRPDVLRSAHPTHSFAAIGEHASVLLAGHDPTRSPLSPDGPMGRLADLNGKILLFCPPTSNTIMHVGEYRAGLPLLDFLCPVMEGGMRNEVLVPDCPWHVRFAPAYEKLSARGLIQEVTLGEDTLRTMRCTDAIEAQAEVMRETPEALLQPGCDCLYCQRLSQRCREIRTRPIAPSP